MSVFQKMCRRFYPQLFIRMEIARLERGQGELRLHHRAMSAEMRHMQEERLFDELSELYEWQAEFTDKALLKRAAKMGIYLDEINFVDEPDVNNFGRYHQLGTFANQLLRSPFRAALVKAIREREPAYKKERQERLELYSKIGGVVIAAVTGLLGTATGLVALLKK